MANVITRPSRLLERADAPGTQVINERGTRGGILIAQYGNFAWVLWNDSAMYKGTWQPDTVARIDVWVRR